MQTIRTYIVTVLDSLFRHVDKRHIRRRKSLLRLPPFTQRIGGKTSYAEWSYVIGVFQTLIHNELKNKSGNHILDAGCGTGLLGLAAEPFLHDGGSYTGIDVRQADIDFCRANNPKEYYKFQHLDVHNPTYSKSQSQEKLPWEVESASKDMVTALSVWTHLNEADATFYFNEIARVLKPGGKAIITFFYLDDNYETKKQTLNDTESYFYPGQQSKWLFEEQAYDSKFWRTTSWVKAPEDAIAILSNGLDQLLQTSGLKLHKVLPGCWKEIPGVYFQDVLIFEK